MEPVSPDSPPEARLRVAAEYGLLFLGWLVLLLCPHQVTGDAYERFKALDALFLRGEVSPMPYSLVGPLFSWPLWLAGRFGPSPLFWCSGYNLCLFTAGLLLLNHLLRYVAPAPLRRRFLLLLVFASPFTFATQDYYGETFTAILVAVGTLAVLTRRNFWGWPCIVLGAVNTPGCVVGLFLASLYALAATRRWRWALLVPVSAGLILLESYLRRGGPFVTGYEDNRGYRTLLMPYSGLPGFSYPLFFGLLSILFSFGKGLLFFTPGLFLPLPSDKRRQEGTGAPPGLSALVTVHGFWLLFTAGLVLVYARWWSWYGGWAWGPRFFLFASLPAALALAARLAAAGRQSLGKNLLTLAALALSFWVGAAGRVFRDADLEIGTANDYAFEHLVWYVPEYSVLWRPFVVARTPALADVLVLGVYAAGFLALALPLLAVCGRQLGVAARDWWAAHAGRPWRF